MGETPAISPQELLQTGDFNLWDKDTLNYIREQYKDKKVLVIDAEDTLVYQHEQPGHKQHEAFEESGKMLRELKDLGYSLVLWSSAPSDLLKGRLKEQGLLDTFDLSIFAENYKREVRNLEGKKDLDKTKDLMRKFSEAIATADWLSDDTKENLTEVAGYNGMDPTLKTPQLLFQNACVVDDNPHVHGWVSKEEEKNYPVVYVVPPYKNRVIRRFQTPYSHEAIMQKINEVYPPNAQ